MCSAHALFVFKVSRLNFLRSFSDRCARSPRSFENHRAVAERRLGRRSFGAKTAFQIQASAKLSQTFESCLSGVLEDDVFPGRNQFVRRTSSGDIHFSRGIRKEQSCSISSVCVSRHKLMASLRLELEESSAR